MRQAPVYFVIAQVRHNSVLMLDSYIPEIQDRMRLAGYPDHRPGKSLIVNLTGPNGEAGAHRQTERHSFLDRDCSHGFIVEHDGLSFQTTDYDTFETFSSAFFSGLEIVHSILSLDYSDRLGMRYLDAVVPNESEPDLKRYLTPGVLGLHGRLPGNAPIALSLSETHVPMDGAYLLSRTIVRNGQLGFPGDLEPQGWIVPDRFREIDGLHAIIDTDASQAGREDFNVEQLRLRLEALHSKVHLAFQASVTDVALNAWG
ncbi:TIGR04255 family protein [Pseudoduganella sp. LjRoot289]|uniref:TIGR04255 family protein n=1 Tax=Pseudoduganella sp. LjRoot289 TaxID=3342314 RepID=UPI003ED13B35